MSQTKLPSADRNSTQSTEANNSTSSNSIGIGINSHWFDKQGHYIPLGDRESRCIFNELFSKMCGVEEFTQIGKYLHIFTDREAKEVMSELEAEHGNIRVSLESEPSKHTYRYIDTDQMIVVSFRSK